ncbi:hypothetical protein CesoFtcFv8_018127 [Champsocephalus esox]|uniref:Uncharacterized protein n=1 Tax=Champsocephalus esox TaxID=159716 RepID=A0AAN8BG06_9TELE|nr:hypothetical protein CesoFtcFv8_018127 [Champsocephalus esox]
MDSTKKITKKLSGHAKGTALWVTSIGRLPNTLESCLVLTTCSVRLDGLFESSLIPRRLRTCWRMWMKAPASMSQPGVSSALDSAPPDESGAVEDSGMAGMDRVDSLAECLVELRNQLTMVLSNQQVSCSVAEPAGL